MAAPPRQTSSNPNGSPQLNVPYAEMISREREVVGITWNYSGPERRGNVVTQSYGGRERRAGNNGSQSRSDKRKSVPRRENDRIMMEMMDRAVHYHFILAMTAQILSFCCIIGGVILFMLGMTGKMSWTVNVWGMKSNIADAAPGASLFVVGVLFVFMTRFCVKPSQIGR
jgi:hypothetical protein